MSAQQHGFRISDRALQTCLSPTSTVTGISRSAGRGQLDVPRVRLSTYGGRAFCYIGPSAWNDLRRLFKKTTHFLCLLLDDSLNISTPQFTGTSSSSSSSTLRYFTVNALYKLLNYLHSSDFPYANKKSYKRR